MKLRVSVGTAFVATFFALLGWGLVQPDAEGRNVFDLVPVEIKRATAWKWTAMRELQGRSEFDYLDALSLAEKVWEVTPNRITVRRNANITSYYSRGSRVENALVQIAGNILAFPGCVGFGCVATNEALDSLATGGGAYHSLEITSTTDTTGCDECLRAMIDSAAGLPDHDYKLIWASVAGIIDLTANIDPNPGPENTYLALQTAPGQGITIQGSRWRWRRGRDAVLQGCRYSSLTGFNLLVEDVDNLVVDRCTFRYTGGGGGGSEPLAYVVPNQDNAANIDEGGDTLSHIHRISTTRNLIWGPDDTRPVCHAAGGGAKDEGSRFRWATYHRNVGIGPCHRLWLMSTDGPMHSVEDVMYNYSSSGNTGTQNHNDGVHYIDIAIIDGPATDTTRTIDERGFGIFAGDACNEDADSDGEVDTTGQCVIQIHAAGIYSWELFDATQDPWERSGNLNGIGVFPCVHENPNAATEQVNGACPGNLDGQPEVVPAAWRKADTTATAEFADAEIQWSGISQTGFSISKILAILDTAGAAHGLTEDGAWTSTPGGVSDRMDGDDVTAKSWLENRLAGSGDFGPSTFLSIDTLSNPTPDAGTGMYADSDGDGIGDQYETDTCGSSTCLSADSLSDYGLPAVIHFVNGVAFDWTASAGGGGSTTFASAAQNSYVYRCGITSQDVITSDGAGGLDTASVTSVDLSCYAALGVTARYVISIGDSLAMVVTEAEATSGTLMDSATVSDRCAIDSECTIPLIRDDDFSPVALAPLEPPKPEDPPEPVYASRYWVREAGASRPGVS